MANVQTDNGYVRIANQIMDELPKFKFNGTQLRIVMTVWRYTYGFQRKEHEMSLSFIEKSTGIDKARVKKQLNVLIESKVILVVQEATFNKSRCLSFNKDFDQWLIEKNEPQGSLSTEGSNQTTPQGSKETPPQGSKRTPKKESIKDNIKDSQSQEIFDLYMSKEIIQHKKFTSDMKKKILAAIKKHGFDEVVTSINNYATILHGGEYWFNTKYHIIDMMRDKDIRQFGSESDPFNKFIKRGFSPTVQHEEKEMSVSEELEEVEASLRLGKVYYQQRNQLARYEQLQKERDRLEQLRTN